MNPIPFLQRTAERSLPSIKEATFGGDVSFGRHRTHSVGCLERQPCPGGATGARGD
jgi:hypothetical protein